MLDIEKIRSNFPILHRPIDGKSLVYFDNAATTQKPNSVIDRITHYYRYENANIHRGVHTLSQRGTDAYEGTRDKIQAFIKARHREEIIFTKGTTESINLLADTLGRSPLLKKGDGILISELEHHSNIVPWQMICERYGLILKTIKLLASGELDLKDFEQKIKQNIKLLAITHTSNALGVKTPLSKIIPEARKVGALIFVDAAQAVAHEAIDVVQMDVDFLAFSGHKMYGPTGVGVLYGKKDLLEILPPYQGGGDMIDLVTFEKTTYNVLPYKFEAGTPLISAVIGLAPAIDFLLELGLTHIASYEHELLEYATAKLRQVPKLRILGDVKDKSAVISFVIEGAHHHDLGTLLDQQMIAVRTGHHCTQPLMKVMGVTGTTRVSFSVINTKKEIDFFIQALNKALEIL
jgi:cysteine desulfurase / selenocysteine lyase